MFTSRLSNLILLHVLLVSVAAARVIEFCFTPPAARGSPFSRELDAEVKTPSGKILRMPAFYFKGTEYAVRARADEIGEYQLLGVTESAGGRSSPVEVRLSTAYKISNTRPAGLSPVRLSPLSASSFSASDGTDFIPVGANLAWSPGGNPRYYRKAFHAFKREGLNWTRVWMCHWGGLNLDWLPAHRGKSPLPGVLDLRVASAWDRVLAEAESNGVYVQLVLQHHGQYTTGANPNWAENPWNAANGGFLNAPAEFFTSPEARRLTALKYRYIVARWGWSPAVLAWELFNEVHWVDALSKDHDVTAVATWHSEMAAYIRSIDVYGHLITTSTEELHSPIYAAMDYFQPHLYSPDMIASPQRFEVNPAQLRRPVFYGEIGHDHVRASDRVKKSGLLIVPPVWASLMGDGHNPAQPWLGAELIAAKRLGELGAVARFVAAMNAKPRGPLTTFSPVSESAQRQPLVLTPGQHWQRRPAAIITIPTDGRYTPDVAYLPHFLVGSPESVADGFSLKVTLRVNLPHALTARLVIADGGAKGAALRVTVDGRIMFEEAWTPLTLSPGEKAPKRPREINVQLAAGQREIVLENIGGLDWVEFGSLDFLELEIPVVAAVGKRTSDFATLWLWRHDGVFAEKTPAPVKDAVIVLEDIASGEWRVTWWDSLKGIPVKAETLIHHGGILRLSVPAISRHAALILER